MNKDLIQAELSKIRSSVSSIETEINNVVIDPPVFPVPTLIGSVLKSSSTNVLFEPYTPVFLRDEKYIYYYYGWGQHLSCKSISGTALQSIDVTPTVGIHYGAISDKFNGSYYHCWHEWISGRCLNHFAKSSDGINFAEYPVQQIWSGEDRSLMIDGNNLVCYIRPNPPSVAKRSIGRMASQNGTDWTYINEILKITDADFNDPNSPDYKKELYSMSVCKVLSNEYWGVVNVYDPLNERVYVQLVHSVDGINFTRYKDQPFIPIPAGINQQYATINYINGSLKILVQQSSTKHGDPTNLLSRFELNLYVVYLSEVRRLLQ